MLKILAVIAAIVVIAIAAVLIYAAARPDTFRVARSLSIKAPPEKIYALISDFRNWGSWSPYEKLDPAMKRTISGAANGKGAVYAWDGDGKAGAGRMEITEAATPSKIVIQLDFSRPFTAHNIAEFTLQPERDATLVMWAMHGPSPYVAKIMQTFVNMDRMIGKDFEDGLVNLKARAEGP